MAIKNEDMSLIVKMVRSEISSFAKNADSVLMEELELIRHALDGANRNVLKLQAQITGLKELLIEKGIVGRQALFDGEEKALDALVVLSQKREPAKKAVGASQ